MTDKKQTKGEEVLSLSEIDEKLMADKDGSFRKSLIEKLSPRLEDLNGKIAKGELAPAEFEAAKKMVEGLKQAKAMLEDQDR